MSRYSVKQLFKLHASHFAKFDCQNRIKGEIYFQRQKISKATFQIWKSLPLPFFLFLFFKSDNSRENGAELDWEVHRELQVLVALRNKALSQVLSFVDGWNWGLSCQLKCIYFFFFFLKNPEPLFKMPAVHSECMHDFLIDKEHNISFHLT